MARAHFFRGIFAEDGSIPTQVSYRVLEKDSDALLSEALFKNPTGTTAINNPGTLTDGMLEFYLDNPKRVRIGVTIGANEERIWDGIDLYDPPENLSQVARTGSFNDLTNPPSKAFFNLGNVDNTTDLNKPISTAASAVFDELRNVGRGYHVPAQGATDNLGAIQAALDAIAVAGGGVLRLGAGTHTVSGVLIVRAGTTIMAYGARVVASGTNGSLLRNGTSSDVFTAWNGDGGIWVLGGIWDGNGRKTDAGVTNGTATAISTALGFAHARDIVLRDVTVRNVSSGHAVEISGCRDVVLDNVTARGYVDNNGSRPLTAAINISHAVTANLNIGASDSTPCRNVTLTRCQMGASDRMSAFGSLVATPTNPSSGMHTGITVEGCTVDNALGAGIAIRGASQVLVSSNVVRDSGGVGIALTPGTSSASIEDWEVIDNSVIGSASHGIAVLRTSIAKQVSDVLLSRNRVLRSGGEGIWVGNANRLLITQNQVTTSALNGISVIKCTRPSVLTNRVSSSESNGISVAGSSAPMIQDNFVEVVTSGSGIYTGTFIENTEGSTTQTLTINATVQGNTSYDAPAGANISINNGSNHVVINNVCRTATNGIKTSNVTGTLVVLNYLVGGGFSSQALAVVHATGSSTGNRVQIYNGSNDNFYV